MADPLAGAAIDAREARSTKLRLFTVPRFVLEDSSCRFVVNHPTGKELVRIRWSEAEAFCKQLRKRIPQLPKDLLLPKYYMSTKKPAELEVKRQHIATLFEGLAKWTNDEGEPSVSNIESILCETAGPSGRAKPVATSQIPKGDEQSETGRESEAPTPTGSPCEHAFHVTVPNFSIDDEQNATLYHLVVRMADGDEKHIHVSWSKMEKMVTDCRKILTDMPKELVLPYYYRKASSDAKREDRRRLVADWWEDLEIWLDNQPGTGRAEMLDSEPMQNLLQTAKPIVQLALQHLQEYRAQEEGSTIIQAMARGWLVRLPQWKKEKEKMLKEAAKTTAASASSPGAGTKVGAGAQSYEALQAVGVAKKLSLTEILPAVLNTQMLGDKTLAVANSIREAENSHASDTSLLKGGEEHDETVLHTLHDLETFETVCAAVGKAVTDEQAKPLAKERREMCSKLQGPVAKIREQEEQRVTAMTPRLAWMDEKIAAAQKVLAEVNSETRSRGTIDVRLPDGDTRFSMGVSLAALEAQTERPEAQGRTIGEMWRDVWSHDVGSETSDENLEAQRRVESRKQALAAAAQAAAEAQVALKAAEKEAEERKQALTVARVAAEAEAAMAREAARLTSLKAEEDSEVARVAAEEEAALAARRALPSFSELNEARTNWQSSSEAKDPEGAKAAAAQGNALLRARDFEAALESYNTALELDSTNAMFFSNRAAVRLQIGGDEQLKLAVEDCERATQLNPNYAKAFSRLGLAYSKLGQYKMAIEHGYSKALLLDPNNEASKKQLEEAKETMAKIAADAPLEAAAAAAVKAETEAAAAEAAAIEAAKMAAAAADAVNALNANAPPEGSLVNDASATDSISTTDASPQASSKAHRQVQQQLGEADKEMAAGTWIHVDGHGQGVYEGLKRATWVGGNEHAIRFRSGVQVLRLKELKWHVVGADPGRGEAKTVCELLQEARSKEVGTATHLVIVDWSMQFSAAVEAIQQSLANSNTTPYVWVDALCLQPDQVDSQLQKLRGALWLDDLHAAVSTIGRVVQVRTSWGQCSDNHQNLWAGFISAAAISSGATLEYAMVATEEQKLAQTTIDAGAQAVLNITETMVPNFEGEELESAACGEREDLSTLRAKLQALLGYQTPEVERTEKLAAKARSAYASVIEREFQRQWAEFDPESQLRKVRADGSVEGVEKRCNNLLELGFNLGTLWSAAEERTRAARVFDQILEALPSAMNHADSSWASDLRDRTVSAKRGSAAGGLQQCMAVFESDFNFEALEEACSLNSTTVAMLEELRTLAQDDATELLALTSNRPEPTSTVWIKQWVDLTQTAARAARHDAAVKRILETLSATVEDCEVLLQAASSELQAQRKAMVIAQGKAKALERLLRGKLEVLNQLIAGEKEAKVLIRALRRSDKGATRTRFRISACKNRMDEAALIGDISSDSDSDASDLEDEFAGGEWTKEQLEAKLVEQALMADHAETHAATVKQVELLFDRMPELKLNRRMPTAPGYHDHHHA